MAITPRDLVKAKGLGLSLAAGKGGEDRHITWAHPIELADPTPYLSGGELVMTTGINIGTVASEQFEYVSRLSSAGIAALAVDTGTTLPEIPKGILAAGNELGLPILKVPASTPFIAITRVVIDGLKADELRSVQQVVDQQEVLARATLRGSIPGVVSTLADSLSAGVVVIGVDGRVLAAAGAEQERLIALMSDPAHTTGSSRGHAGRVIADGEAFVVVQSLRAAQALRGYLAVRTPTPLPNSGRLLVAHAVSLVSIAIEKPARVADAEQRLRMAVTRNLLGGASTDGSVLRYFGFEPRGDVVVLLLTEVGPVLAAEQHVGRLVANVGPYLMASLGEDIVIVVPAGNKRRILALHDELGRHLHRKLGGGLSQPARLSDTNVGVAQARIAAAAGNHPAFTEFDELGPYGVLLGARTPAELRILAGLLQPLIGQRDDLMDALTAFLEYNGQVEAAAAALQVHRHTMRNRIQRIAELLGDDLTSADTRAQLWLALRARNLLATVYADDDRK
ncbi:PucR family transcriptional regulator [Mycolicibacterium fluoranthenivorans]|uniref:Purine catabolism regulatory protein n=1 Tax=Mycolicibacterium fluoranthenivorans TaxID=258505 RepID=A0A1G4WYQ9_9MYCO|nr:PucR family transcriptional regulator [Mycolicibacterium fluoranthenivorans]SCX32514.1 purine catabolism regulatory protein [Mycolicibacterium fluoranthenivorans]